jgi:hypothetical protein
MTDGSDVMPEADQSDSAVVEHLRVREPKKWAAMPAVEQAAYNAGWLDASARLIPHVTRLASDEGER